MFLDFDAIKRETTFGQVVAMLGLEMKKQGNQWRGACPACRKGGDRALVVTEGKGFFCFGAHKGGDQIALVAHIRNCSVKDAAKEIKRHSGTSSETVPRDEEEGKNLSPLGYLEFDHDAVIALGFNPEVAKRLGIGYAGKGLMRGTVAVPVRDEHGAIQGYIGLEGSVRLPPDFMSNVVPLRQKA